MSKKLILFTLVDCHYCENLKNRLIELSIPYNEIEINENPEIWNEVLREIEHELVPTVFIADTNVEEGYIYIPTIDYQSEEEIVQIITEQMGRG